MTDLIIDSIVEDDERIIINVSTKEPDLNELARNSKLSYKTLVPGKQYLLFRKGTFTRSNGTVIARLYERLTKRSRRRLEPVVLGFMDIEHERFYRRGVYDAYKSLQEELNYLT